MADKMIINKSTMEDLADAIRDALGDDETRNAKEMIASIPDVKKKGNIEGRCEVAKSLNITNPSYNNIKYKLDENSAEYVCTGFATNSNITQDVDIKEYIHTTIFPVTKLADKAFFSKSNINIVTLPGSLNSNFATNYKNGGTDKNRHFQSSTINTVNFGNGLEYVPYMMFDGATIQTVNLNEVKYIGPYAFKGAQLESIELPESVTTVGLGAFASQHLQSILINNSFTHDTDDNSNLFVHGGQAANNLQSIFYRFTKDDGEDFLKDQASTIDKALTYFYSKNYPEKTGRYWHFDSENNPSIWENYPIGDGVHIFATWDSQYNEIYNIYETHFELIFEIMSPSTFGPGIIYHNSSGDFLNINISDVGSREPTINTESPIENLYDIYNFLNEQEYYDEFKFIFNKLKEDFSDYQQFENLLKNNRSLDLSGHFKIFYAPVRQNFLLAQPLEIIANGGNIPTFKSTKKTLELTSNMLDGDFYLHNERFYFNKEDLNDDNTFYLSGYNCIIDKSKSENYEILEEVATKHPDYSYLTYYDIKLKLTDVPARIYLNLED